MRPGRSLAYWFVCGLAPLVVGLGAPIQVEVAKAEVATQIKSELIDQAEEGLILTQQGKLAEARQIFERTIQAARQQGDREAEAMSVAGLGLIYAQQEQQDKALETYQQALKLVESSPSSRAKGRILFFIGREYQQLKQLPKAIALFQQAWAASKDTFEPFEKAGWLSVMGRAYNQLQQYDQALEVWLQAIEIYTSINEPDIELTQQINNITIELMQRVGLAYRAEKQYENALQYLTRSLELLRSQPQPISQQAEKPIEVKLAETHRQYGDNLRQGNAQAAIAQYQKSLDIIQKHGDRYLEMLVLNEMGIAWSNAEDYAQAVKAHQQSLQALKQLDPKQYTISFLRSNEGNILTTLGSIHQAIADSAEPSPRDTTVKDTNRKQANEFYARAIEAYQQALQAVKQADPKQYTADQLRTSEGLILTSVGNAYSRWALSAGTTDESIAKHQKAIEVYQQALAIYQKLGDRTQEVALLEAIAGAYIAIPDMVHKEKATTFYQQVLAIHKDAKEKDSVKVANTLDAISKVYSLHLAGPRPKMHEYGTKALEAQKEALAIYQEVGDRARQLRTLEWIQVAAIGEGNYFRALEAYRQALAIKLGKPLDIHPIFNALLDRQVPQASQVMAQKLLSNQAIKQWESSTEGLSFLSTGGKKLHQRLWFLGRYGTETHDAQARSCMNLVSIAQQQAILLQGKHAKSLPSTQDSSGSIYRRALALCFEFWNQAARESEFAFNQRANQVNTRNLVQPLLFTGLLYLQQGESEAALEFYQKALVIAREFQNQGMEVAVLNYLGQIHHFLDQPDTALEYYQQALTLSQKIDDPYSREIILRQMGQTLLSIKQPSSAEVTLREALELWERNRIELAEDASRPEVNLARSFLYATREQIYHHLQHALVAQNKYEAALEISERGRSQALLEQILNLSQSQDNGQQKRAIAAPNLATIRQVAKAQNATLVQYSLIQDINGSEKNLLYIWVVQPNGQIAFHSADLATLKAPLQDLITISRDAIGARGRSDIVVAAQLNLEEQKTRLQELHELLIAPIANLLPQDPNQRVVLIPQGDLFLTPFAALQDAKGKYLIEKHTLSVAPSIQVLALTHQQQQTRNPAQRFGDALVVGNPTMPNLGRIDPKLKDLRLDPLPAAAQEAEAIAQMLNTQALIGSRATEAEVVKRMETAQLIHLATHGLLDSLRDSSVITDIPGAIALASSGSEPSNNGLLISQEIASLKLKADLVVLSACDTGRGEVYGGDSVIGLSRSFFAAGVPSIIVSLWAVPDAPTAELMTEFYKNWQERKLDKAQALRQAMLTTMKTHANPRDWAAFTLMGEAE